MGTEERAQRRGGPGTAPRDAGDESLQFLAHTKLCWPIRLGTLSILTGIGLLAGMLQARRAVGMDPVESRCASSEPAASESSTSGAALPKICLGNRTPTEAAKAMIDFQKARSERRLLQALFDSTFGFELVSALLKDAAEELAMPLAEAAEHMESLRHKGLVTVALSDDLEQVRVWLTERGMAIVESGESKPLPRRHG